MIIAAIALTSEVSEVILVLPKYICTSLIEILNLSFRGLRNLVVAVNLELSNYSIPNPRL